MTGIALGGHRAAARADSTQDLLGQRPIWVLIRTLQILHPCLDCESHFCEAFRQDKIELQKKGKGDEVAFTQR